MKKKPHQNILQPLTTNLPLRLGEKKAETLHLWDRLGNGAVTLWDEPLHLTAGAPPADVLTSETPLLRYLHQRRQEPEVGQSVPLSAAVHLLLPHRYTLQLLSFGAAAEPAAERLSLRADSWTKTAAALAGKIPDRQRPVVLSINDSGLLIIAADNRRDLISIAKRALHSHTPLKTERAPAEDTLLTLLPALRLMMHETAHAAPVLKVLPRRRALTPPQRKRFERMWTALGNPPPAVFPEGPVGDNTLTTFHKTAQRYREKHLGPPQVVYVPAVGFICAGATPAAAALLRAQTAETAGAAVSAGNITAKPPRFDIWETLPRIPETPASPVNGKIAIVTGAAQGFGAGIAAGLFDRGANVIIADLNQAKGNAFADELNRRGQANEALFVKADVSRGASVDAMVARAVAAFGGLDTYISNAGILRAGGLDDMDEDTFQLMTKVNYSAYFLGAKAAARVFKRQAAYGDTYPTDIIQINSKSGLKGSNKNFAYAGSKFGGIGLTQSFALELVPYGVKVNSICPGNFFDGPLWSDPERGLFVQYLKAGKVPGAQTIADVKTHYESQVPMKRGCGADDVMTAILYLIQQLYETGQAVPVTGGQNMLK